jgi:hypothetical protein
VGVRSRSAVGVAAAGMIVILAVRWIVAAAAHVVRVEEDLAAASGLLRAGLRQVRSIPILADSVAVLEDRIRELPQRILSGTDAQIAGLDLARRLATAALEARVSVDSVQPVPSEVQSGQLRRAASLAYLEADAAGILDLLGSIGADPALEIESVDVIAVNPLEHANRIEILSVRLVVAGWFRPPAPRLDSQAVS